MTNKEVVNADGSRNWQANILLDNIKRLEQENAELKAYMDVNEDFKTAWKELKAENERLKAEIKNNKSAYQVELGTYNMECGNLLKENENLLQTLQEIKEIAEYSIMHNENLNSNYQIILQLITKAEEE